MRFLERDAKIFIAGHRGLVGSAIVRQLQRSGHKHLITRTHSELDLTEQTAVQAFFKRESPEYVFLAAARVGGILANNTYPADFIVENLAIQTHVIDAARQADVRRLLFLGSSCIYPRDCPQPIREEYLLTGPLEATNRSYAIAKIAGIEMCRAYNRQHGTRFLAIMPTNAYGLGDNYDLETSHVLPALIRKMHEAKIRKASTVTLWGTGAPRREFIYSDDLADACAYLMGLSDSAFDAILNDPAAGPLINIGWGRDQTIRELAETVRYVVGFEGKIIWDTTKPDGTPRKMLDTSRLSRLGWRPRIELKEGITLAYQAYQCGAGVTIS